MNGAPESGAARPVIDAGEDAKSKSSAVARTEKRTCVVPLISRPVVTKFAVNSAAGSVPPGHWPALSFHSTTT